MLSRSDCVYRYRYLGYITQRCAGGALAGCYEPTCQMLLFPYTQDRYRPRHAHPELCVLRMTTDTDYRYRQNRADGAWQAAVPSLGFTVGFRQTAHGKRLYLV